MEKGSHTMSILSLLVGIALAPVFIAVGLAAMIIESLFEDKEVDWDD